MHHPRKRDRRLVSLPYPEHFRRHPESVAQRVRQLSDEESVRQLRELRLHEPPDEGPTLIDLTPDNSEEDVEEACRKFDEEQRLHVRPSIHRFAVERTPILRDCPLDPAWPTWDILSETRYFALKEKDARVCQAARRLVPTQHLGVLELEWEIPDDSVDENRIHLHAETEVNGHVVHIDWVESVYGGPLRGITEFRLFVDGVLAGRAGGGGCSLGGGGSDLPLVARVGWQTAVTLEVINGVAPVVERWKVSSARRR